MAVGSSSIDWPTLGYAAMSLTSVCRNAGRDLDKLAFATRLRRSMRRWWIIRNDRNTLKALRRPFWRHQGAYRFTRPGAWVTTLVTSGRRRHPRTRRLAVRCASVLRAGADGIVFVLRSPRRRGLRVTDLQRDGSERSVGNGTRAPHLFLSRMLVSEPRIRIAPLPCKGRT